MTQSIESTSTPESGASSTVGFWSIFNFMLGWRNAHGYVIPLAERKRLAPDGLVHIPTAVQAKVQS